MRCTLASRTSVTTLAALASLALGGCQDDVSTPFPEGLEPFDDDAIAAELAAERTELLRMHSVDGDTIRVYGRGFVFAPPSTVWAVSRMPATMIALCKTSSQRVTLDVEPVHALSFLVHYVVEDILTVEWDDQWRGDVIVGTADAPAHVMIKHQKVQGSDFISVSEGTVQLFATDDPQITEVQIVEHLEAISGSTGDVAQGMQHNYDRIVAAAHGAGIPVCRSAAF